MSKEWTTDVAAAQDAAQRKQAAEDEAHQRFDAVRAHIERTGSGADVTQTDEFGAWMQSRRETDLAWGEWAMAMDKQAGS